MATILEVIRQRGVRLVTVWRVPVKAGPKCIVRQVDLRLGAVDRIAETRQLCFRALWGSAVIEVIVKPDELAPADRQFRRDATERRQESAPMVVIARNYNEMPTCPVKPVAHPKVIFSRIGDRGGIGFRVFLGESTVHNIVRDIKLIAGKRDDVRRPFVETVAQATEDIRHVPGQPLRLLGGARE